MYYIENIKNKVNLQFEERLQTENIGYDEGEKLLWI